MKKKNSLTESLLYHSARIWAVIVRALPVSFSPWYGRMFGLIGYLFDSKRRSLAYANLKTAFVGTKTPAERRKILKKLYQNYAQNFFELFKFPVLDRSKLDKYIRFEGREYVQEALKRGKGVILLAMHSGNWEMANLVGPTMGRPYKVIVNTHERFSRLDDLLNAYRERHGAKVIRRGIALREFVKSLRNNEIIGVVADQGGRDGELIPFFGRDASMSAGAIRLALKLDAAVCFTEFVRDRGPYHRVVISKALDLERSGDIEEDVKINLKKVVRIMEENIRRNPSEYMWFYKIWKYSKQSKVVVLSDGKAGHLRQSQSVAAVLQKALMKREISSTIDILNVQFKNNVCARAAVLASLLKGKNSIQGRLGFLKWLMTRESFEQMMSVKADYVISCGSGMAPLNYLLARENLAKNIVILKPSILNFRRFNLVVVPKHDVYKKKKIPENVVVTEGAPNLIDNAYLRQQVEQLVRRFSHLNIRGKFTIGLLLGGDTKKYVLGEQRVKMVVNQIKEVSNEMRADILVSTSRRTSSKVESMLLRDLKKHPNCKLLIIANQKNVPEAVGGILGLSDVTVVSGDSISMISEAAASGKKVVVFPVENKINIGKKHKHERFVDLLNNQGYVLSTDEKNIKQSIYNLTKNKIQTRKLDDNAVIFERVKRLI